MYNLIQPGVASDTINRLAQLKPESKALWGNLTVTEMLTHCQSLLQLVLGETKARRSFAGIFFGAAEKKMALQDEPMHDKLCAHTEVMIKDTAMHEFFEDRRRVQSLLQQFARKGTHAVVAKEHPYFGKLSPDEWGILCWKQLDHHLRQFGV